MQHYIEKLIKNKITRYKEDYSEMIGDYNRELETIKGYNGRQLLELLQNCDDEESTEVLIKFDQEKKQVSIHNIGTPFSQKGYRSLFISNLSSKKNRKKKYIGNKGLGFRSIINWSNGIEIQSNNMSLYYSEENRKQNYESLFNSDTRKEIREEEHISKNIIPLPFLTMPKVKEINQEQFVTSIIIDYKKAFVKDIADQIRAITPETILFLNHIQQIKFEGLPGKEDISCTRQPVLETSEEFAPKTIIEFQNNTTWEIFEQDKPLPEKYWEKEEEEENYQIKIAIEKNFESTSKYLYSFFPTKIQLSQPYVLHATFDLDATRNQINDSKKNKYILKKIVKFTVKVSTYFAGDTVSYKPLEILHHMHKADTLDDLGYYELIEDVISNQPIFPCIDNTYKCLKDVIYISNDFAQMLIDVNGSNDINCHLISFENESGLELDDYYFEISDKLEDIEDIISKTNRVSSGEISIIDRANFIYLFSFYGDFIRDEYENSLDFLINENNKLIKGNEYIYTPVTKENQLKTPDFAKIQFVNSELFEALLERFNFYEEDGGNKSRFIYDELTGFCNIHSYEPATLAQKIISEVRKRVSSKPDQAIETIQEMNSCLYHNYLQLDEDTSLPNSVKVPLLNKNNKVSFAEELMLSSQFPMGEIGEIIFENIYELEDFVASPKTLGLIDQDIYSLEKYLLWLGVNKFAKYQLINSDKVELWDYREYVNELVDYQIDYRFKASVFTIKHFDKIIKTISVEKILLWIHFDSFLKNQLTYENEDQLTYKFRTWHTVYSKPSYIEFLIDNNFNKDLSNYLIDEKFSWVNSFSLNYRKEFFLSNNISKSELNSYLILLNAKEDFNDLSIEKVIEIINSLPEKFPSGRKTQSIYKRALTHYDHNQEELHEDLKLFANNGNELKVYNHDEIYFSDKVKLPKQLHEAYPIFNFPLRAGGAEAIDFFGINDLGDIELNIESYSVAQNVSEQFAQNHEQLKPLLLTYRLNVIDDHKQQKREASICKKMRIVLCSEITYRIEESNYKVADYEFIQSDDHLFYIKINENESIKDLKRNRQFTNTCADIVSLSFDVKGDKNEFRHVFSNPFDEMMINIKSDFGEDIFNEARDLLGLADHKQAFWEAVFNCLGKSYELNLDDLALEKLIKEVLSIEINLDFIDYEALNRSSNLVQLQNLFNQLEISVDAFANEYTYEIDFSVNHVKSLINYIRSKRSRFKFALWKKLSTQEIDEKIEFLHHLGNFENMTSFIESASHNNKHEFEINLDILFQEYILEKFEELDFTDYGDVMSVRNENAKCFAKDELDVISQNEHLKSSLYFKDSVEWIKSQLIEETEELEDEVEKEVNQEMELIDSDALIPKQKNKVKSKNGVFTPKNIDNKRLKEIGNKSEESVYKFLTEHKYENVDWVSKDDEGLHYDLRYSNKDGIVKYVEVKTFDNGRFILSKAEYDFGLDNKENYEIWLVKNKHQVIPIKDFFFNNKYKPIASEYDVYLDFKLEEK